MSLLSDSEYYELKTQEALNLDGVILHEMYFENIEEYYSHHFSTSKIYDVLTECFKSAQKWEDDFQQCAMIAKGWVIFGYESVTQTCRNIILSTHDNGHIIGLKPLLVLDCYEHAYFIDYGTAKQKYIEKFISNINWKAVEARLTKIL